MLFVLLAAIAATPTLPVWIRAPGDYLTAPPPRFRERAVPLTPLERRTVRDLQYERTTQFEGIPLAAIVSAAEREREDTALLHFANGMDVQVALDKLDMLDLFVATAVCAPECTTDFPVVAKKDSYYADRRPIRFTGNKLVIASAKVHGYTPFRHVDSLTGIELVHGAAYDRQFEVTSDPEARKGLAMFHERCQACHGVRRVGATFGWDYVVPVALSTYRSPKSLAMHVRHREKDAPDKGILMPELADVDDETAASLWRLLDAFSKQPLRPYTPR